MTLTAARPGIRKQGQTTGFNETYNRSDREIVGDNGWYTTNTSPNTGVQAIRTNRLRPLSASSGFPGSSGTIGSPIAHDVVHAAANIVDVSFDIVTGVLVGTGILYAVVGATKFGGPPATIDSGVLLRLFINGAPDNVLFQKITATNSTVDHSPGTFPAIPGSSTTTIRVVLTRSTGVVQIYVNGTLQYTSGAGDFSGLTGSIVAFQFEKAYTTTPIEIDNVVAV